MASEIVVYGIENCDQVRKARQWLRAHGLAHRFHDFRANGLETDHLARWMTHIPWDSLLNRRGMAWRQMPAAARAAIVDQTSARELMLATPTLVKRPILEAGERVLVGFSEPVYRVLLPIP